MACSSDDQQEPSPDAGTAWPDADIDSSSPDAGAGAGAEDSASPEEDVDVAEETPAEGARIEIEPSEVELTPGRTHQMEATLYEGEGAGRKVEDAEITWRVEDEEVARVSESGLLRGVGAGKTRLIAASGEVEASVEVRVGGLLRVELAPEGTEIDVGEELQLALKVHTTRGEVFEPDEDVTWTSSAPELATVDADGLVTGLKIGNAVIAAEFSGLRAHARVNVEVKYVDLDCDIGADCVAITEDGELYTLGESGLHMRPDGLLLPRFEKVEFDEDIRFKSAVSDRADGVSFCAISTEDRVYCWGRNRSGELGRPVEESVIDKPTAIDTDLRFQSVVLGKRTACGLSDAGALYCWGDTRFRIGLGEPDHMDDLSETPVLIDSGPFSEVVGNGLVFCVQEEADQRWACIGQGRRGQLGNGANADRDTLSSVEDPQRFQALAVTSNIVSGGAICALDLDQQVWCWGYSDFGELGQPNRGDAGEAVRSAVPRRTSWDDRFVNISAIRNGFCAETSDHKIQCWGDNMHCSLGRQASDNGQQGDGHWSPQEPVEGLPDDWTLHSGNCVLSESGRAWCWGFNRETSNRTNPIWCDAQAYRMHSYHD